MNPYDRPITAIRARSGEGWWKILLPHQCVPLREGERTVVNSSRWATHDKDGRGILMRLGDRFHTDFRVVRVL